MPEVNQHDSLSIGLIVSIYSLQIKTKSYIHHTIRTGMCRWNEITEKNNEVYIWHLVTRNNGHTLIRKLDSYLPDKTDSQWLTVILSRTYIDWQAGFECRVCIGLLIARNPQWTTIGTIDDKLVAILLDCAYNSAPRNRNFFYRCSTRHTLGSKFCGQVLRLRFR